MTHPGLKGDRMRALRVFEAGSSGFLKPPPSLHARETRAAQAAPRPSLSLVDPPPSPSSTYERENGHCVCGVFLVRTGQVYGNRVCM